MPRETRFVIVVRLACGLASQIIDPSLVGLQDLASSERTSEIEPAECVSNRVYFIAHMALGVVAHSLVEVVVVDKIIETLRHCFMVTPFHQEAALAVLHL